MKAFLVRGGKIKGQMYSPSYDYSANTFGSNSGNLAYQYSVAKFLDPIGENIIKCDNYKYSLSESKIKTINSTFDAYVLPMANNLGRENFASTLREITKVVESLTIPCIVVGIGVQTGIDSNINSIKCKEEAKAFVKAILEKSASIGVRGEFTKEFICSLGFDENKVDVIGCPSMYINGPDFKIKKRPVIGGGRISFSYTPDLALSNLEDLLYQFVSTYPYRRYIAQRRDELSTMLLSRRNHNISSIERLLLSEPDHFLILNNEARFFTDFNSWVKYCRRFDLSIGTRLHGIIANILAGVPSYLIAHDSRTLELAKFHGIPHRHAKTIQKSEDILKFIVEEDYSNFNTRMKANFNAFIGFLNKNGIEVPTKLEYGVDEKMESQVIKPLIHLPIEEQISILSQQAELERNYIIKLKNKLKK